MTTESMSTPRSNSASRLFALGKVDTCRLLRLVGEESYGSTNCELTQMLVLVIVAEVEEERISSRRASSAKHRAVTSFDSSDEDYNEKTTFWISLEQQCRQ